MSVDFEAVFRLDLTPSASRKGLKSITLRELEPLFSRRDLGICLRRCELRGMPESEDLAIACSSSPEIARTSFMSFSCNAEGIFREFAPLLKPLSLKDLMIF